LMIDQYHIELIQMMENAGGALARLAVLHFLNNDPAGKRIALLCGRGGNGGGALVCARRLASWGARPVVFLSASPEDFTGVPAHQLEILRHMQIPVFDGADFNKQSFHLIIDGLIGYNLHGAPRGLAGQLILQANDHAAPVLSLDIPSGLDGDSGRNNEPTIRAAATMTLALPKQGLYISDAIGFTGDLFLADISVPPALYQQAFGLEVGTIFKESDIVQLVS